ncbi:hypothetical protein M422DRAFT_190925, partial [Sphaerobolus stellatus SS14]
HTSSAWNDRTAEFALYLYLIVHFKDTLLPSSILGFCMTATGVTLSRFAGSLIDDYPKLGVVRFLIITQKLSSTLAYVACAAIIASGPPISTSGFLTPTFLFLLFCACLLHFSNIAISIAVERDWAACIARSPNEEEEADSPPSDDNLACLNTYLRQINLLCKLLAPLFVSTLTIKFDTTMGFKEGIQSTTSIWILSTITFLSMVFELYWIGVVYRRFPGLAEDQSRKNAEREQREVHEDEDLPPQVTLQPMSTWQSICDLFVRIQIYLEELISFSEWREMAHLPIFFSSASISLLYLTVLSFDGIMVSYLKTLYFTDDFIAEMRGICVVTGLIGTAIASPLEKRVGSVRAGNWSIWSMVFSLIPVIISFYEFAPRNEPRNNGPALPLLGALLLFGGMALSRIGLWSFDLIQTKQLQDALVTHPRRNTLTGLQFTMQNVADLMKYILTMILYRPSQFRWAATVSFASVTTGAVTYMVYVKKERGHIAHIPKPAWIKKIL